jgi:hypothetical protein
MNQAAKLIDHIESIMQSNGNEYYQVTHFDIYPTTVSYIQDISEEKRNQHLLNAELENTHKLFSLVLPTEIVQRITFSDPKLSFSVQACSIMFVSLLPVETSSDSNTFQQIFTTLNQVYSLFDQEIVQYPTLKKIRSDMDAYSVVGGLFQESNQPLIYAREIVKFGLDCISKFIHSKIELEMRVGIHSGGPIVTGLIGRHKVEITGAPAIIADEIREMCPPNSLLISRSTYELIYGTGFNVKENGNLSTTIGAAVMTYQISS